MVRCYRCGQKVPKDIMYCPNCGYNLQLDDRSSFHADMSRQKVSNRMPTQRKGSPISLVIFLVVFIVFITVLLLQVLPLFMTNQEKRDLLPAPMSIYIDNDTGSQKDLNVSIYDQNYKLLYSEHIFLVPEFHYTIHYAQVFINDEPIYLTMICNDTYAGQVYSGGILVASGLEYYIGLSLSDGTWYV